MPVVLRASGFRVLIYVDDHDPAHVHVIGDGEAKISLLPEVRVAWVRGMNRATVQKAIRLVSEQRVLLLERWNEHHA
ncbi:MAG: DUF4160 domain-containing protein [Rhizobiaceae bacterium]|nr:DUF4160 domain-containing protein [Rhizobiaceae bacterium]